MNFIFYTTLLFLIFIFGSLDINIDYDFWARLVVGKSFFETGTVFHNDFYSFGTTHESIDHEWGSGLIFYLIQNHFGDIGLFFFKSIIIFLTFFLVVKTIQLREKKIELHFLLFFIAIQALSYEIFSTIRCQIFSFCFFVFYIYILEYVREKKNYRMLWTLPLLNIIWLNCHGGFVLGIFLILLYSAAEYLNKNPVKPYIITFLFSCFTCLINPYGFDYLIYIFKAFLLNREYIPEWHSIFSSKNIFPLLKLKLFIYGFILSYFCYFVVLFKKTKLTNCFKNIDKVKYFLLLFTLIITIKSLRCCPFFVYTVLIFCYKDFNGFINKKALKILDFIFFILISVSCLSHLYDYRFLNRTSEKIYPVYCVEFIKQNNLKGNVFTNFHTGSYTAYKLFPNNFIYMDGRYEEVYDNSLIEDMKRFFLVEDNGEFLKKYHFDILILDKLYPESIQNLKSNKDWFPAYEEKAFVLFLPSKLRNINFKIPNTDINEINKQKFKTNISWK